MGVSTLLLHAGGHGDLGAAHLARCALLVEPWRSPNRWCPDGQSWTVAALAPSWLAYPVFYDPFLYERSHLIIVALALAILPSCVALLFLSGRLDAGAYFNHSPHTALYLWPPAQMPDFLLGCVSAELAARSTRTRTAHMADGAFLLIALAVLVVPNPALDYRAHAEILFDHGLAPLFALFLWAAARDASNGSKAARVFAHATLASLGTCSFEVYLFQWPVHTIFVGLGLPTTAAENFVAFALVAREPPPARWRRSTNTTSSGPTCGGCEDASRRRRGPRPRRRSRRSRSACVWLRRLCMVRHQRGHGVFSEAAARRPGRH